MEQHIPDRQRESCHGRTGDEPKVFRSAAVQMEPDCPFYGAALSEPVHRCENYHGRYEYACVQSMEKTTELLIAIAAKYANR